VQGGRRGDRRQVPDSTLRRRRNRGCSASRRRRACFNAAKELHAEIAKDNASFKKVEDSMNAFTNNGYQWFQVAELNYDVFMVRHSHA
jgi:hypothetical protein